VNAAGKDVPEEQLGSCASGDNPGWVAEMSGAGGVEPRPEDLGHDPSCGPTGGGNQAMVGNASECLFEVFQVMPQLLWEPLPELGVKSLGLGHLLAPFLSPYLQQPL